MRVAFVDRIGWDYRPDTVDREPLGGSQSAVCYLTAALAQRGVTVALVNHTQQEGKVLGVACHHVEGLPAGFWQNFDAVVLFNESGLGLVSREDHRLHRPHLCEWLELHQLDLQTALFGNLYSRVGNRAGCGNQEDFGMFGCS
ncbi:MAG: hypothetical protein SNJ60_00705, partial [Pseudanabaenaceae cyanobacterium]